MAPALTPEQVGTFHEQGFVVAKAAFPRDRILRLRAAIEDLCARAAAEEAEGGGESSFPWQWLDREQRLPARMGDFLQTAKYYPVFGEWMAEDAIPQLQQLVGGAVRHNRFQMLASGGGQPYLQNWVRRSASPSRDARSTLRPNSPHAPPRPSPPPSPPTRTRSEVWRCVQHRDWGNTDSIIGVASPTPTEYADACRGANGKHVEWNTPLLEDEHFLQVTTPGRGTALPLSPLIPLSAGGSGLAQPRLHAGGAGVHRRRVCDGGRSGGWGRVQRDARGRHRQDGAGRRLLLRAPPTPFTPSTDPSASNPDPQNPIL